MHNKSSDTISTFKYRGVSLSENFERVPTDTKIVLVARERLLQSEDGQMRIYFAHPQSEYGTEQERSHIRVIENYFSGAKIVNPGELTDLKIRDMGFYLDIVHECDVLVYVRLLGKILSGVGLEAEFALKSDKRVDELKGSELKRVHRMPKYLSLEGTLEILRAVGSRE